MRLLSLDTSSEFGSCALWHDGKTLARECPAGRSHSETLLPLVNELLAEAGMSLSTLDGIAFGAGPGAFTGLRVSCGIAQGLAVVDDLPVLPISSLAAMAWMASSQVGEQVAVALDARMGEVYWGLYQRQADAMLALAAEGVFPPAMVPLPDSGGWLACGNGLSAYPALCERLAPLVNEWRPEVLPHAVAIATLAVPALARNEGIDAGQALPVYVRDKVALTTAERLARGGKA